MAGFAAAVSAARHGLKTLIVERFGCLGGVATHGGVHFLLGGRRYNEKTGTMDRTIGGIFDELTDRLMATGGALNPDDVDVKNFNPFGWYPRMAAGVPLNNEQVKALMETMCEEAGVEILYFTSIVDVVRQGDRIAFLVIHNKSGLSALSAKVFVDSTGDGDIAFAAGCPTEKGRPEDGLMTPVSLEMVLENVDGKALVAYQNKNQSPKLVEIVRHLKEQGDWPFQFEIIICMQLTAPDVFLVNTERQWGVDGTDSHSVSRGMIQGRKNNRKLYELLKAHFPGFGNSRIRYISDVLGVRETRRIIGRHVVTVEEALGGKKFEDCVASTTYNWDLPDPKKPGFDPMMGDTSKPKASMPHEWIQIPYRSLLPQGVVNLIVAGRCVSVEREVLGPARIMGPCMGMGHAVGIASALVVQGASGDYGRVDVKQLQSVLLNEKSLLPPL